MVTDGTFSRNAFSALEINQNKLLYIAYTINHYFVRPVTYDAILVNGSYREN